MGYLQKSLTKYALSRFTVVRQPRGANTMTLPVNLWLVRHGQSEGNAARRLSEAGDHTAYSSNFRNRHSGTYRLTNLDREQAEKTGRWIIASGVKFHRFYTSEYVRAKETAGLLGIPGAEWFSDPYLTERDWGDLDICPENERNKKFGAELKMRAIEPFFWRPPNGESFMMLCQRVDRVLHTLHRECGKMNVIVTCHGETMRAFQLRIERLTQARFHDIVLNNRPEERIHNCEVIHYTRTNQNGTESNHMTRVRKIRPTDNPVWDSGWKEIVRPRYSNKELLKEVSRFPSFMK